MIWKYFIAQHSENLDKVCNLPTKFDGVWGFAVELTLNIITHLELDSYFCKGQFTSPW